MRCVCCNHNLSDFESVLRHPITNEFLDICKKCLPDTGIVPMEPTTMEDDVGYDDIEEFTEESDEDLE